MSNYDIAQKILKKATQKKKDNDIEGALKELERAYELCSYDPNDSLPISVHLRYPKYLLLAGKNDEAWSHLSLLLSKGYSGQDKDFLLMDYENIYKAMSLFHKKENNKLLHLIYEDMSLLAIIYHDYIHSIENTFHKDKLKLKLKLKSNFKKLNLNINSESYINLFILFSDKKPKTNLMGGSFIADFNQKANLLLN